MPIFNENDCLWIRLQKEKRPIVLYGTGNGADKILDTCLKYNISISGVFASNGFVRNRTFRDMPVESLEAIEARLGNDIVVLLCFGTTRADVIADIDAVASRHTLYIPDVPLYGGELFDWEYYRSHRDDLNRARAILADDISREVFDSILGFRLTGEKIYLEPTEKSLESYKNLLGERKYGTCVDCGAFIGDSTSEIAQTLKPEKIIAIEPDARTFKKLSAYAENESICSVMPINAAVGECVGEVTFTQSASRGSGVGSITKRSKTVTVAKVSVDSVLNGENADFIKYDVEGAETEALEGSLETIRRCKPSLAISVYHRTADIFEIPLYVFSVCGEYDYYLRRVPCIPAWDITLFAVKKR